MISYRVADTGSGATGDGLAFKLRDGLEAAGYTVFLDVDELEGGDDWKQVQELVGRAQQVTHAVCGTHVSASSWAFSS